MNSSKREQPQAKHIDLVQQDMQGIVYVLDAIADQRIEASGALRGIARQLDNLYMELEGIADELEEAREGVA